MEIVSESFFFTFLFVAYLTRNDGGIPFPIKETCNIDDTCWKRFNLWEHIVGVGSKQEIKDIFIKNFLVWSLLYTTAHILTHVEPQRRIFKPFKFNPNYPPSSLIIREIVRSVRGVFIASMFEVTIEKMYANKIMPFVELPSLYGDTINQQSGQASNATILGFLVLLLWWDFHFYWTHRLLHTKWLFKYVHKVHHESYNPDPFSGTGYKIS